MKTKIVRSCLVKSTLAAVISAAALILQAFIPVTAAPAADTKAPSSPAGLRSVNITYTSISLSWTAAQDDSGVKGYQVYRDGKKILSTSKTCYTNSNLLPGRKYTYMLKAYDAAGNVSADSTVLTAETESDTQSPSEPAGLSVLSQTSTDLTVSWNPARDNTSVKGYEIYCSEKKAAITASTYYTVKGLLPGKNYSVYIKAYDIAGNFSAKSNTMTVTTTVDNTPPSIPSDLKASSVSGTEINLAWSPSSDNLKIKSYEIYLNGTKLKATAKTTFNSSKLIPGTSYTYTVRAIDSSDNMSGFSIPLKVNTTADKDAPTAPSKLKVKSATKSSASLTWNASTDNIKVKGYRIYWNGIQIAETSKTHYTVKSPLRLGIDIFHVKAFDLSGNISEASNKAIALSID